jgi:hypothetical protein
MHPRLKFFDRKIQTCNPIKEFWEFLEELARRRQYPEPMYIWYAKFQPQKSNQKKIKFPARTNENYWFPGKEDDYLRRYRR